MVFVMGSLKLATELFEHALGADGLTMKSYVWHLVV
jgi:hypothetical protein